MKGDGGEAREACQGGRDGFSWEGCVDLVKEGGGRVGWGKEGEVKGGRGEGREGKDGR